MRSLLPGLFLGEVMADGAAADRAEHAVMAGVMASHAAHDCALETTSGLRRRGGGGCRERQGEGGDSCVIHGRVPLLSWAHALMANLRPRFGCGPDSWQGPGNGFCFTDALLTPPIIIAIGATHDYTTGFLSSLIL